MERIGQIQAIRNSWIYLAKPIWKSQDVVIIQYRTTLRLFCIFRFSDSFPLSFTKLNPWKIMNMSCTKEICVTIYQGEKTHWENKIYLGNLTIINGPLSSNWIKDKHSYIHLFRIVYSHMCILTDQTYNT